MMLAPAAAAFLGAQPVAAQVPADFLIQMVCVDSADQPIPADPVTCPTSRRKLAVGEPLPYHKVDHLKIQISDSFPVADANGITKGVQTYFYVADLNAHPLFPDMVHFNPLHGGYNILGADAANVFFRGTHDASGGWQPWWTSDCQAKGWRLFPNDASAFRQGAGPAPTRNLPACPGVIDVSAATVEWRYVEGFAYASGKTLDSLIDHNFAPASDAMEANYFTREYGVTRWEAWRRGAGVTNPMIKAQCPGGPYEVALRGSPYHLYDCHDWTTLHYPPKPWDPDGASPHNPNVPTWPVDPLYTRANLLRNTHIGGPYANRTAPSCSPVHWNRTTTPSVLNWAFDTEPKTPWTTSGNCTLIFSVAGSPRGEAIYQEVAVPPSSGRHTFGALLWAPGWTPGPQPAVHVHVVEMDLAGHVTGRTGVTATLSDRPTTFQESFAINPATRRLYFVLYPQNGFTNYQFTGAWIAKPALDEPARPAP